MAFWLLSIFFLNAICLTISGIPQVNFPRYLNVTTLDGKKDCGIVHDEKTISFFKIYRCDKVLPVFDNDFFNQVEFLPCIGMYDALFNLCEFDVNDINLTTPKVFNNSKTFCESAATVYNNINFTYRGAEIEKWASALKSSMVKNDTCNHLCVLGNNINSLCLNMVVAANEYLRLRDLKSHKNLDSSKKNLLDSNTKSNIAIGDLDQKNFKLEKGPLPAAHMMSTNQQEKDGLENTTALIQSHINDSVPNLEVNPVAQEKIDNNNKIVSTDTPQPSSEASNSLQPQISEKEEVPEDDQEIIKDNTVTDKKMAEQKITVTDEDDNPASQLNETPEADKKQSEDIQQSELFGNNYVANKAYESTDDSLSFSYSATVVIVCFVMLYFLFHYKNKLFALAIEGRKGRSHRGRGRPSSANYSKLHSNLEEAIASNVTSPSATHVLY